MKSDTRTIILMSCKTDKANDFVFTYHTRLSLRLFWEKYAVCLQVCSKDSGSRNMGLLFFFLFVPSPTESAKVIHMRFCGITLKDFCVLCDYYRNYCLDYILLYRQIDLVVICKCSLRVRNYNVTLHLLLLSM